METKVHKYKAGLNTKFFHLSTIIRIMRNAIDFLKNQQGIWVSGKEEIGKCFEEYFTNLFSSSSPLYLIILIDLISQIFSKEDLAMLSQTPTIEEIKGIVFN